MDTWTPLCDKRGSCAGVCCRQTRLNSSMCQSDRLYRLTLGINSMGFHGLMEANLSQYRFLCYHQLKHNVCCAIICSLWEQNMGRQMVPTLGQNCLPCHLRTLVFYVDTSVYIVKLYCTFLPKYIFIFIMTFLFFYVLSNTK